MAADNRHSLDVDSSVDSTITSNGSGRNEFGVWNPVAMPLLSDSVPPSSSFSVSESFNEALFLYLTAGIGVILNATVVACILASRSQRRITSSFVIHGCALDAIKCAYCIPFATSLLRDVAPGFCAALGGSYVVIVTASGFNIVAMVCCEAYAFGERSGGGSGASSSSVRQGAAAAAGCSSDHGETGGSVGCAVFGVLMVYIGSVIVHLGPTIIGGDFNYNDLIGNCIFVYGTIKSYVVQTMWIIIMTLAMAGAVYYLIYFDRHVRANSTHRLAALVRASVAISRGNTSIVAGERLVRAVVRQTLSRSRVLIVVTVLFILSWYPLYILTLVDPKFQQPTKIYKLLTFLAWSNPAVNPVVLILFDHNIGALRHLSCCRHLIPVGVSRWRHQSSTSWPAAGDNDLSSQNRKLQRSRHRSANERGVDMGCTPPSPTTGPASTSSTPHRSISAGVFGGPSSCGAVIGSMSSRYGRCDRSTAHSPPETVYDRVGSRLWREGELPLTAAVVATRPCATYATMPSKATASGGETRRNCNGRSLASRAVGSGCNSDGGELASIGLMTLDPSSSSLCRRSETMGSSWRTARMANRADWPHQGDVEMNNVVTQTEGYSQ